VKLVRRLATLCLAASLMIPIAARAGGDRGKISYDLGEKDLAKKEYARALRHYRRALGQGDARAHCRIGLIEERAGRLPEALKEYRLCVELVQPEAARGDAAARARAIEGKLKKEKRRSGDLLARGKSLYEAGSYREAEKALLQAAARDDHRAETHFYLGEVYLKLEEYGKAKTEYLKAKRLY
jgi:tetratricopeptide (TPR) repeat protein